MLKKIMYLLMPLVFSVFASGCMVAESTYVKKEAEAMTLSKELQSLQKRHENRIAENAILKAQSDKLQQEFNGLKNEKEMLSAHISQLSKEFAAVSADRDELDRVLKLKSDDLSKTIWELRGQVTSLQLQNKNLQHDGGNQGKSETQENMTVRKTYDDLMKALEDEVAKGQVAVTESQGKLTLDILDDILFNSGVAEIKSQGLPVLKRVVEILKDFKDKAIQVEGHMDDRKMSGTLVKKYATNWELSAARAISVTRYLQNQGIAPEILSAVAFGQYKPVAENATPEGRVKNRRISIVLLPKD